MNYKGILLAVSDITKAKTFYQNVLKQIIIFDAGTHVSFENGLSLQEKYEGMININASDIHRKGNNFQLYFEVEEIMEWFTNFEKRADIDYLHKINEYPWGQKSMRIYDVDGNIIEIAENMDSVIKRYLNEKMSLEDISKKTMYPIEYIKTLT